MNIDFTVLHEFAHINRVDYNQLCAAVNKAISDQTAQPSQPIPYSGADETPPVFARRWRLADDGFGLQRDDNGTYVHIDDALSVLHATLAQPAESQPEEWGFWDAAGLQCSGYSSETDHDLISVFIETGKDPHWHSDIAERLHLDDKYVTLMMEILCSADFCEYGTSPRGAWAIHTDYESNIKRLTDWYLRTWGHPFDAINTKETP